MEEVLTETRNERGGRAGGPAAKTGGESRRRSVTGRCGDALGSGSPRVGAASCCEDVMEVRMGREPLAVMNRGGGVSYRWRGRG